jgi:Amt family ammonium transporter
MMPEETILPIVFSLLIPFSLVGIALINTGLNRTRSAAHSVLSSMCAAAVAVLAFVVLGSAISGFSGQPEHVLHIAGIAWGWAGAGNLFSRGVHAADLHNLLVLIFQLFAVSLAVQIPVASGAERWRLVTICISTALLAGLLFPYVSNWIWGSGFLSQLGTNFGLGYGVIDAGGAGVVQVTGGLTALVIAWLLGARQGKFTPDGIPTAMPGHNAVVVVVGSLMALLGWIGLSAAGALLFYAAEAGAALFAVINTLVAAASGAVAALVTTRLRFGKPDVSLTANGWVCGLVAVSAGAPFFKVPEAMIAGLAAGVIIVFAIEVVEVRMQVDDPAGAISVHVVGGIWGLLAAGMFADLSGVAVHGTSSGSGQFLAQLIAVGTLLGFVVPLAYGINFLISRIVTHRVDAAGERQGMDLYELGAGAYPEFMTHREDFLRR